MSKGFKTGDCPHPLNSLDNHTICFQCLGRDHQMDTCKACLAYTPSTYRKRSLKLKLWCCFRVGAKPPGRHSIETYKRLICKYEPAGPVPSEEEESQEHQSEEEEDEASPQEGAGAPPSTRPATGGLGARAATLGVHPLDPPGVQRRSGLGDARGESNLNVVIRRNESLPSASMSVAPGASVPATGGAQGGLEQYQAPMSDRPTERDPFWGSLGPNNPGLEDFLRSERGQEYFTPPSYGLPAQSREGGSNLNVVFRRNENLPQGFRSPESPMDTSATLARSSITPARTMGGFIPPYGTRPTTLPRPRSGGDGSLGPWLLPGGSWALGAGDVVDAPSKDTIGWWGCTPRWPGCSASFGSTDPCQAAPSGARPWSGPG